MPSSFEITAATNSIRLDPNRSGQASFTVFNGRGRPAPGRANIVPLQNNTNGWYTLDGNRERDFDIALTSQYTVRVTVPPEIPAGSYSFRLDMVGVDNPDEDSTQGPVVTFEVPEPAVKKPIPWKIPAIIVALVLVVIVAAVGFILKDGGSNPGLIPEVVAGSSIAEATAILTKAGFVVADETQEQFSGEVARGMVTGTDPPVGSEAAHGATVTLLISRGSAAWKTLHWEIIGDRPIIDPTGKHWEKYEQDPGLSGLYLPLKDEESVIETLGDYLELKSDNTFEMGEGENEFSGSWQSAGDEIVLNID